MIQTTTFCMNAVTTSTLHPPSQPCPRVVLAGCDIDMREMDLDSSGMVDM